MGRTAVLFAMLAVTEARAEEAFFGHLYDPPSIPVSEVLGMVVRTPEGRSLGRIRDLLYHPGTGEVDQVLLEHSSYPVSALVASDRPHELIIELPFVGLASAGASALVGEKQGQAQAPLARASRQSATRLVIDLRDGRLN
jgi:sporulation protein YlmC with PRC-barrel domain